MPNNGKKPTKKRSIDLILISQYSTCSSIVVKWNYRMNLYHPCMSIKQFILCQGTLNMSEAFNWWSTSIPRVCCQKDTITFNYITFMTSKNNAALTSTRKYVFYFMTMNENTFYQRISWWKNDNMLLLTV